MSQIKETKTPGKSVTIAVGIVCVILMACLVGAITAYTLVIDDKNSKISSLDAQISQLDSSVTNLQKQITSDNTMITLLTSNVTNLEKQVNETYGLLNATSATVDEITANPSAWVNKKVVVEGVANEDWYMSWGWGWPPWDWGLNSNGATIGVFSSQIFDRMNVLVLGVVTAGQWSETSVNGTHKSYGPNVYFIEAETVQPL